MRKVNKYFVTIPVSNWQTAKLFGSETNWKILEALRDVGQQGLTAEEISKKTDASLPTVYNILSKLAAADLVESTLRRPSWGRPSREAQQHSGEKPKRVYIEYLPWGNNEFDRDFGESLDLVLEHMEKDVGDLGSKWSKVLENVALAYQKDELKKFFPQDAIHEKCGCSHEGMEFLYAISLELIGRLFDSKDFEQLARRYKFMK